LFTSVDVRVSHPLTSLPSQLLVPAPHITDETRQTPPAHNAETPAAGIEHRVPHPPQLFKSPMPMLVSQPLAALPSQSA
jgi:hypothetical protein